MFDQLAFALTARRWLLLGMASGAFLGAALLDLPQVLFPALGLSLGVLPLFLVRSRLPLGLRQIGCYRLLERVGEGAMGEVWRAEHARLGRPVAVKLVDPGRLDGKRRESARMRFEREARSMARLSSPHTVRVFDYGIEPDGTQYYAMELLDGLDLETLVERHGPLAPARAARVLRQVCSALAEAHQAGIVHRDVKPANVVLCRRGQEDVATVVDFGIAIQPLGRGEPRATGSGLTVGTPATMSPEAIRGRPVDARSDVYGLGCVAHWLLTGRYPFEAEDTLGVFSQHLLQPPVAPSRRARAGAVPPMLDAVVLACLEKEPARRPASMEELSARLEQVLEQLAGWDPVLARQPDPCPTSAAGSSRTTCVMALDAPCYRTRRSA